MLGMDRKLIKNFMRFHKDPTFDIHINKSIAKHMFLQQPLRRNLIVNSLPHVKILQKVRRLQGASKGDCIKREALATKNETFENSPSTLIINSLTHVNRKGDAFKELACIKRSLLLI
ncbi:hypothetical protein GOP47_0005845 [Adiantum capillus-veneris]|uniref:Uncharacterized protein n=1 Tax=Adiantum capillus-veneris TaxID=13818 RepID=A0A9D4ZNX3_ADICA|nr:hypothetical protein GOP47_0005845 [Adiantum capillus-veneris]